MNQTSLAPLADQVSSPLSHDGALRPVSRRVHLLYGLANVPIGVGTIAYFTVILPVLLARLLPHGVDQTPLFLIITVLGAVVSILVNLLVGWISDRVVLSWGRRRPWLLLGTLLTGGTLAVLPFLTSITMLILASVFLQAGANIAQAALSAFIPDQVPLTQRGMLSAAMGMGTIVGAALAQLLVVQAVRDISRSCLILAILATMFLFTFFIIWREPIQQRERLPLHMRDLLGSIGDNLGRHPDFALVWGARCLVFLGYTTLVNYLPLLMGAIHVLSPEQSAQAVQTFFGTNTLALLLSSLVCGKLSDRLQRRKPFVIGASILLAAALLWLFVMPQWFLLSAIALGLGMGGYLAVDFALASELFGGISDNGKESGIVATAVYLPMLIAPVLAAVALGFAHNLAVLLLLLSGGCIGATLLIVPVKQVR